MLWHNLYNWTTYGGILTAFTLGVAQGWLASSGDAFHQRLGRWSGAVTLWEAVCGLAACGLVMLLCFVLFR